MTTTPELLEPVTPGEILLEEFLRPAGVSPYALAKAIGVPRTRIERIVRGVAPITPDTALRLERALGPSAETWMNIQRRYDLKIARRRSKPGELDAIRLLTPETGIAAE